MGYAISENVMNDCMCNNPLRPPPSPPASIIIEYDINMDGYVNIRTRAGSNSIIEILVFYPTTRVTLASYQWVGLPHITHIYNIESPILPISCR